MWRKGLLGVVLVATAAIVVHWGLRLWHVLFG